MTEKLTISQVKERIKLIDDSLIVVIGSEFDDGETSDFIEVCSEDLYMICSTEESQEHVNVRTGIISEEKLERIRKILEKWDGVLG